MPQNKDTSLLPATPMRWSYLMSLGNFDIVWTYGNVSDNLYAPSVRYGTHPEKLEKLAIGTSVTYNAEDMCNAPANITAQVINPSSLFLISSEMVSKSRFHSFRNGPTMLGMIHHVLLKNLSPATTYYYQYGNDRYGWSKTLSFVSRPEEDSRDEVRFLAYADMGVWGPSSSMTTALRALQEVEAGYNHFLLHFGDIR